MDNQDIIDALRDLKDAVSPIMGEGEVMMARGFTPEEADRLFEAWAVAVRIVGRIDRPAQYRPIR